MTPEELRLECLKLVLQTANASGILVASGEIISRAHGGVVKANGAQNLELALEEVFQVPAPASHFEPGVFAGPPTLSMPAHRMAGK